MSAIRSTGNAVEVALRSAIHRLGLRFRVYPGEIFGRPDFVFPSRRIAVFVDGDFWHGRVLVENGVDALRQRHRNNPYWIDKMLKRVHRDELVTRTLEESGWLVLRFWESDVKKDLNGSAHYVCRVVEQRRREIG